MAVVNYRQWRCSYCQPGGDNGCLLGHPTGDPARFYPAHVDQAYQPCCRADLHSGDQHRADDRSYRVGTGVQALRQPDGGLRHRGDRRDVHRQRPAGGGAVQHVEVEEVVFHSVAGAVFRARRGLSGGQLHQDPRWRLGSAGDGPGDLYLADDVVTRASVDASVDGRRDDPDGGLRQERPFQRRTGCWHGDFHGEQQVGRTLCAAAQYQAQQSAARARRDPYRGDPGRSVCGRNQALQGHRHGQRFLPPDYPLRLP